MKKIILTLALTLAFLAGCSQPYEKDPYRSYHKYTAAQLFNKAKKSIKKENFDVATKQLEALDGIYPFGPYAKTAQLDLIYAYYMNGEDASAVVAADRYVRLYPRSKDTAYAYYLRGLASFSVGESWLQRKLKVDPSQRDTSKLYDAYASFRAVVVYFPKSSYAADSALRMSYIRNLIAGHYMTIAEYYYSQKAYVAAANRASDVVQEFQESDKVPSALAMMVKSYRKMGLTKLAHKSYLLLAKDYPQSKAFRSVHKS